MNIMQSPNTGVGGELHGNHQPETIDFYGCKFLDFSDNYCAKKNLISSGGTTKVVWFRKADENALCQFCSKRGRINEDAAL
jgi:hypothetical protein